MVVVPMPERRHAKTKMKRSDSQAEGRSLRCSK
jgi:hypothetical protein